MAKKAAEERFVEVKEVVRWNKKKEKKELLDVMKKFESQCDVITREMERLLKENKEEKKKIKELGERYVHMSIDYDSGKLAYDAKQELGYEMDGVNAKKMERAENYKKRKTELHK